LKLLDELDKRIIEILKEDARTPFTTIASKLGISEAAVRKRVRRLVDSGVIKKFTIETSMEGGAQAIVMLSVNTKIPCPEISREVRKIEGVRAVYEVSGEYDIVVFLNGPDNDALNRMIDEIRKINGVLKTTTMVILKAW